MSLKEDIKKKFNLCERELQHYCADLQILPRSQEQLIEIMAFIKGGDWRPIIYRSDVKGQSWYGRAFIEVPFAYY